MELDGPLPAQEGLLADTLTNVLILNDVGGGLGRDISYFPKDL